LIELQDGQRKFFISGKLYRVTLRRNEHWRTVRESASPQRPASVSGPVKRPKPLR